MKRMIFALMSGVVLVGLTVGCRETQVAQNSDEGRETEFGVFEPVAPTDDSPAADDSPDGESPDGESPGGEEGVPGGGGFGGGGGFDPSAIFDRIDGNQDGKLTGEELSGRIQNRVEQLDKDGNGEISREEFDEGFAGGGGFDPSAIFDRRDENQDGKLSTDELSGSPMQDRAEELDKDGDGAISREEFVEGIRGMFGGGSRGAGGGGFGGRSEDNRPEE
jgi:hypothetical protein